MKLFASFSEAIREGAKLRPQAFGLLLGDLGSCAIGAGLEAMDCGEELRTLTFGSGLLGEFYPYMNETRATLPCDCGGDVETLHTCVMHLNDQHNWTRERIADWLETEEEKLGFVTVVESESAPLSAESQAFVGELR